MSEQATLGNQARPGAALVSIVALAVIVALLIGIFLVAGDPLDLLAGPPVENITVDKVRLPEPGMIVLTVTNDGQDAVTIAQVRVDDAYWRFTVSPSQEIPRLASATVSIPYPWVPEEAHVVSMISSLGATFDVEIPVAFESPAPSVGALGSFALVGLYVGVLPVLFGILLYPALRRLGSRGVNFILAVTVGLLLFLAVDTTLDALEGARELPAFVQGVPMVFFVALVTLAVLVAVSSTRAASSGPLSIAYMIAFGIGLHNMGEGLAIGAAYALGTVSLGRFLILGFALHNVTEGIGIAAPLLRRETPRVWHFVLLVLLAGLPAVAGTWIGGFTFNPVLSTLFLAAGVGAILQVIWAVGKLLLKSADKAEKATAGSFAVVTALNVAGVFVGVAIMYATAFFIEA